MTLYLHKFSKFGLVHLFYLVFTGVVLLVPFPSKSVAQDPDKECPRFALVLPRGLSQIDEPATISVVTNNGEFVEGFSFVWSVPSGKIRSGEGTRSIQYIPQEDDEGKSIRISVEINSNRMFCKSFLSDTLSVAALPIGEPVDSIGTVGKSQLALDLFRSRLDVYFHTLSNGPVDYEGLIVVYFKRNDKKQYKKRHVKLILEQAQFREVPLDRLSIVAIDTEEFEMTTLWTVPPSARLPKDVRKSALFKAEEVINNIDRIFKN